MKSAMLTLRQIEVIRSIMVAGTVKGAAEMLGVSAPGISRLMKHTEDQIGLRLFSRSHGRYVPTDEARDIFSQINGVYASVGNLQYSLETLKQGKGRSTSFAAVPSIAHHVFPAAIRRLKEQFPELRLSLNVLKIEEAIDYLLLRKGEMVALSYRLDHPGLTMQPLYRGELVAILPKGHALERKAKVSVFDLVKEELLGIEPEDPYGRILAAPFLDAGLEPDFAISARTGHTLAELVGLGLGVAVMDALSISGSSPDPRISVRPIEEPTVFRAYAAFNAEQPKSVFAEKMVEYLQREMSLVRRPG